MGLGIAIWLKIFQSQTWQVVEEPIAPDRPALRGAQHQFARKCQKGGILL